MGKEIKIHHDFNKLRTGNLTEKQQDLILSIIYKFQDVDTDSIILTFAELKELSDFKYRGNERFIKTLEEMLFKLLSVKQKITKPNGDIELFVVIPNIIISKEKSTVEIFLNKSFKYILKELEHYTLLELKTMINLKSSYSKILYRLFSQWDSINKFDKLSYKELKEILGVPDKYRVDNVDQRILKPCIEELTPYFPKLKAEKIKKGVKVDKIIFTWQDKKKAEKEKVIKEAKNIFNKAIADKKTLEIEKEVQELKTQEKNIEMIPSMEERVKEPVENKIKITRVQYEELYQTYLKENNIPDLKPVRIAFDRMNKDKYEIIDILEFEDIPQEKLLSKAGNILVGGALTTKLLKLSKELRVSIKYQEKIIKFED